MDFSLNDDQRAFVESARAFAEGAMAPNAARWDEESIFPKEVLQQAGVAVLGQANVSTQSALALLQ